MGPNECIYFAPHDANKVLCISADGTVKQVGPDMPGESKYSATGVVAPDGSIYFAPCNAEKVLHIDF